MTPGTSLVLKHPAYDHEIFSYLRHSRLEVHAAVALLYNYDAHASLLRRLLLNSLSIMPEPVVGFVLENVRNEYGNGDYDNNHKKQLLDLISLLVERLEDNRIDVEQLKTIQPGVRSFMQLVVRYYPPRSGAVGGEDLRRAAIAAGAITTTELLALEEFRAMQAAFRCLSLADHIWFDHVHVESEHCQESLELARYFEDTGHGEALQYGLMGCADATKHLYDGFMEAMRVDTGAHAGATA